MRFHGNAGATALVGMDGFEVGAQFEAGCEWWQSIQTTADMAGCPACGSRAVGNGRRWVKVRDLPISGRPVIL